MLGKPLNGFFSSLFFPLFVLLYTYSRLICSGLVSWRFLLAAQMLEIKGAPSVEGAWKGVLQRKQQQQQGPEFSGENNEGSHIYIHLASYLPLPQSLNLMLDAHWYSNAQNKTKTKQTSNSRQEPSAGNRYGQKSEWV